MRQLENYFKAFRDQIIGIDQSFTSPFGKKKLSMVTGLPVEGSIARLSKNYRTSLDLLWPIPIPKRAKPAP